MEEVTFEMTIHPDPKSRRKELLISTLSEHLDGGLIDVSILSLLLSATTPGRASIHKS